MRLLLITALLSVGLFAQDPNTPAKWTISGGKLPAGLTLTEAGLITGKPTETGTFTFTIKVDYLGQSKEKPVTLTVNAVTGAVLEITVPDKLPAAALGGEYAYQLNFRLSI